MKMEFSVEYCFEGIMEFKEKFGDILTVKKFEDRVIKLAIPKLSYLFMKNVEGSNKKAHVKIILTSNDPKLIYETAKIKGVNTQELSKAMVATNDAYFNFLYAKDVKDANITMHEDVVVNGNDNLIKYYFAKDVFGSNKRKLGESVLNGSSNINYHFAMDIKDGLYLSHLEVVRQDEDLYDILVKSKKVKDEETLEKQYKEMNKESRRVLRRLDYIR